MSEFTLKKSTMERYDIRLNNENSWRCTWATISISDDGFFNAQTDCGNFSYKWGAFGDCFKSFLLRINDGYLYNKISSNEEKVDIEKTVKQLKAELLQKRRVREIDEDDAAYTWEEIEELESDCDGISPEVFYYAIQSKSWLNEIIPDYYDGLEIHYKPDQGAQTFCEVVMPVFIEILKKELTEKKTD